MVIFIYENETDLYIPTCFVLCSHKNKESYCRVFKEIQENILKRAYNVNRITLDFEEAEKEALKEVFPGLTLIGCKFHFKQALLRKAKKKGLMNSHTENETLEIINNINEILESRGVNLIRYLGELEKKIALET